MTTRPLPSGSNRAGAVVHAPPDIPLRPFLLVLSRGDHGFELVTALQQSGMPCVLAFDAQMIEYWWRVEKPMVAVIDVGAAWVREVSDRLIRRGMLAVALSDDEEERIDALSRGFQDSLPASLSPKEVAVRLRQRFLAQVGPQITSELAQGPLRLDPATRRVWWRDEERHLGPMQFDLLAYLAARPDTMVPIDTILRDIWREAWGLGQSNKVTKMIGRIREALGPDSLGYVRSSPGYYGFMVR